jgi:hypothetical protein
MNQTASPLQVALSAPRPIRDASRQPRREPPAWHHAPDDLTADPLVERYARPRKENQAARVLAILDQLERGGT